MLYGGSSRTTRRMTITTASAGVLTDGCRCEPLPPDQQKGVRIEPYLLKTWLGRREFGDVVSSAEIEDDAAWLASLADQTAGVAVQ